MKMSLVSKKKRMLSFLVFACLTISISANATVPNWRANLIVTGIEVGADGKIRIAMKNPITGSTDMGCTVNDNAFVEIGKDIHQKEVVSVALAAHTTGRSVDVYFDSCIDTNWAHISKFMIHD